MAFPARYKGTCKTCGKPIEVGQFITWSRREKGSAYHADCSNPSAIVTELAPKTSAVEARLSAKIAELQAAIEKAERKLSGAPEPKPETPEITALVTTATLVATATPQETIADAKSSKSKLKDNAPWWDVLSTIVEWANDKQEYVRILLIGPPGTGKSTTGMKLTSTKNRITFTEGMGVEDGLGMFQLIKGETVWCDGPIVTAMRKGEPIIWDEVDHHPTEIGSALYGWMDDAPHATLPTGEIVKAEQGYSVIATTNSNVTALPEAILDRFDAVIPAILPHPSALACFDNQSMKDAVSNHFKGLDVAPWTWSGKPTLRRMRAFAKLKPIIGEVNAAAAAFGSAGREMLGVLTTASRSGATSGL